LIVVLFSRVSSSFDFSQTPTFRRLKIQIH